MKKISILLILLLTGCSSEVKTLECTITTPLQNSTVISTVYYEFTNDEITKSSLVTKLIGDISSISIEDLNETCNTYEYATCESEINDNEAIQTINYDIDKKIPDALNNVENINYENVKNMYIDYTYECK